MATHTLPLNRSTLHGHFSKDLAPVLRIADGDTVRFSTLDAGWNAEAPLRCPKPDFERDPELDRGHALCGPIYVEGAQAGLTLAVQICPLKGMRVLRCGSLGWTVINPAFMERLCPLKGMRLTERARLDWQIDDEAGTATNQFGHRVALSPFMGVMGNAPAAAGIHATRPPRRVGGNMDLKELVSGSTLYLPIEVEGALFSVGDGHAAQGDGEVSGTAIECPMREVVLTFHVRHDMPLKNPRALTPVGSIVMGFNEDLNKATNEALNEALDLLVEQMGVTRHEAFTLASVLVDLRVTQMVNQVSGVHAIVRSAVAKIED